MPTLIDCFGCLCLNNGELDDDCNLGYEIKSVYCGRENGWHIVSSNCELVEIKTADGIITRPTVFELEIEEYIPYKIPSSPPLLGLVDAFTWRAARL